MRGVRAPAQDMSGTVQKAAIFRTSGAPGPKPAVNASGPKMFVQGDCGRLMRVVGGNMSGWPGNERGIKRGRLFQTMQNTVATRGVSECRGPLFETVVPEFLLSKDVCGRLRTAGMLHSVLFGYLFRFLPVAAEPSIPGTASRMPPRRSRRRSEGMEGNSRTDAVLQKNHIRACENRPMRSARPVPDC